MKYEIFSGGTTAVCSSRGAELVSLKKNDHEYIWQGDPVYWNGQNPILFPVLCSLKEGKAEIGGKVCEIQKHGFARKSEFELYEKTDDSVTFVLRENESTMKVYPFSFEFYVKHTVYERGFITSFRVVNNSCDTMYFHLGGHTGINIPFSSEYKFSDHFIEFDQKEYAVNYKAPTGGLVVNPEGAHDVLNGSSRLDLDYSMFAHDAIMLTGLESKRVRLLDPKGRGVSMYIGDFAALGIWTPSSIDSPFICLEPWNGLPAFANETGKFEDKPFVIKLDAAKEYSASFSLEIL